MTDTLQSDITIYDTVIFNTQVEVGSILLFGAYDIVSLGASNSYNIQTNIPAQSTTTTTLFPTFTVTDGSAVVRCDIANINPLISTAPIPYYFAAGDVVAFTVPTDVGGIIIYGDYTVRDADSLGFTFTAQNAANQTTTQSLNYSQLNLTYYATIGPQLLGLGYGKGFYKSYSETVNVTGASSSAGYATLTLSGSSNFQQGETITVSGVGSAYNGSHKLDRKSTRLNSSH